MERLNDILKQMSAGKVAHPAQRRRRVLPGELAGEAEEATSWLPVGAFLSEENETQDEETAAAEGGGEPISLAARCHLLRRRKSLRVVDSTLDHAERRAGGAEMIPRPLQVTTTPGCPICKGLGYLREDVPYGHPQFGKLTACKCQQARKNDARRRLLREQSHLDELEAFREAAFDTFQVLLPGVQEAYEAALHFAHQPHGWLVLVGNNGCGKTHLAVAIAKHCLEEGEIVLFAVVPDLLDYLRATFSPDSETHYDDEFTKMREANLLILDDLGAENSTGWANEKLFQLLNHRYNARLATVITTNKIGLSGIENRIRSRLMDRRLVRVVTMGDAQDFRAYV